MKLYGIIIDKGECLSTLNNNIALKKSWKSKEIRNLAGRSEWQKHNFQPQTGMLGEIVDNFYNTVFGFEIYIILIDEKHYVPISEKGIKIVEEEIAVDLMKAYKKSIPFDPLLQADTIVDQYKAEAPFYCQASQLSIKEQILKRNQTYKQTQLMINQFYFNEEVKSMTFDQLVDYAVDYTYNKVKNDRDDWNSFNSIAWHLGLLCYAWKNSLPILNEDFEKVFIKSWEQYFIKYHN